VPHSSPAQQGFAKQLSPALLHWKQVPPRHAPLQQSVSVPQGRDRSVQQMPVTQALPAHSSGCVHGLPFGKPQRSMTLSGSVGAHSRPPQQGNAPPQ